ncbi:phospholipid carrier-dependent glycosyltransferase [Thalassotalea mangrovi]|uniref:Phospholipid carrier-dependent glycosyltransferase n=2 Tax=Thalassotalea mangrovi TaxID=2572245 RepID=A0A4U1B789_9GAMM|nr:phospholipid carrier-dependent glycosyltransferase [Thalassotalea mangrovi]
MNTNIKETRDLTNQLLLLFSGILVISLLVGLYLPGIDIIPLYHEETRRALVAREMLANSSWFTPTINQQAYWAKPPLFNWSIIAASLLTDGHIDEFVARLPSMVFAFMMALALWLFSRQIFDLRIRAWLVLMFLLTPELIRKATSAELDTVFMVLVNLSLFSWFYFWHKQQTARAWYMSMTFVGLAYLCKREAALLCYFLTVVGYLTYCKSWSKVNKKELFGALLIPFVCAAMWWIPMLAKFGWQASVELNQAEIAARQSQGTALQYLSGVLSYPVKVWLALLPAGLLLPLLISGRYRQQLNSRYTNLYPYCLIALISNLIPIMLIGDSNVRYYLPMFVPALLLTAMILQIAYHSEQDNVVQHWHDRYLQTLGNTVPMLTYGVIALACLLLAFMAPVSSNSNIGLMIIFIFTLFIILGQYRRPQSYNTSDHSNAFVFFSVTLVLLLRLFDISYSMPYRLKSLSEYRDIDATLKQINQEVKNKAQATGSAKPVQVYGDYRLPHALYFYDNKSLIRATDCISFDESEEATWLFIQPSDEPITIKSGDTLLAQFPFFKKHRLHLINTSQPGLYCR